MSSRQDVGELGEQLCDCKTGHDETHQQRTKDLASQITYFLSSSVEWIDPALAPGKKVKKALDYACGTGVASTVCGIPPQRFNPPAYGQGTVCSCPRDPWRRHLGRHGEAIQRVGVDGRIVTAPDECHTG